jgi:integrase
MPIYERIYAKDGKSQGVWWFGFWWNGQHIQRSTKLKVGPKKNRQAAKDTEAAYRTALAKGEAGIYERKPAPIFAEFAKQFKKSVETQCAAKPSTVEFYFSKLDRLLEFTPLAQACLDQIDEAMIASYVQHRRAVLHNDKPISPASVNRELATLRKALRLAHEWRIINRVPRIRMLPGERIREFVLSRDQERIYLEFAPSPLKDAAVLMLDTGLRVGEVLALEWRDVTLSTVPAAPHGFLSIRRGKTANARRFIPLTSRACSMFEARKAESKGQWVFPDGSGIAPLSRFTLRDQHVKIRQMMKLPGDAVIHALRHTCLTRLGEAGADAFSIMRLAGHSTVTVSQKYVHPSAEALGLAIQRLEAMNARDKEKLSETPKTDLLTTVPTTVELVDIDHAEQVI